MDSHRQSLFAPLDVPSQVVLSIPSLAYHLATKFRAVVPLLTAAAMLGSIVPIGIDAQVESNIQAADFYPPNLFVSGAQPSIMDCSCTLPG